jgi:hypothetical protein
MTNAELTIEEARERATKRLGELLKTPGNLRVITSEHACQGTRWDAETDARGAAAHPSRPEFDAARCDAYEYPLTDARHFVCHDVVALEGPDAKGRYRSVTAEGDYTIGYPEALLVRLTQANAAGA